MLDIALRDGLQTEFQIRNMIHADPEEVIKILSHPLIQIGASDAGAHVAQFCGAGDTSDLLGRFVRTLGKMTLEGAVKQVTSDLADTWGIANRGRIATGAAADLVLFDPDTIGRQTDEFVSDFPGEARRYVCHAIGVDAVIVNGAVVREGGEYTDARTGRVI